MAVRLKPCFGCPVRKTGNAKCADLYATMKARVSGLGLRTAIFDCPVLMAFCPPGTRVVIPQKYMADAAEAAWSGEYSETRVARADVPATVLSVDATGFSAVVDREAFALIIDEATEGSFRDKERARFRRRMPFSRIVSFLPEPPRKVCGYGNTHHSDGTCDSADGCSCDSSAACLAGE